MAIQAYAPTPTSHNIPWLCEHFCAPVIHPVTGASITQYKKLKDDPATGPLWTKAFGKEFRNLTQGDSLINTAGTDAMFVLTHEQILAIPKDRVVTYARIVVDYRPQKADPNRVRITAGGNLIKYPGELSTRSSEITTSKLIWNSVISTENAKYLTINI